MCGEIYKKRQTGIDFVGKMFEIEHSQHTTKNNVNMRSVEITQRQRKKEKKNGKKPKNTENKTDRTYFICQFSK